jgi:hypothetical protein
MSATHPYSVLLPTRSPALSQEVFVLHHLRHNKAHIARKNRLHYVRGTI